MPQVETVNFISTESGSDLIVSFAINEPDDLAGIVSFTIVRTPKFEPLVDESERGASVSFEREDEDDDSIVLLCKVTYAREKEIVTIETTRGVYTFDVHKVDPKELKDMCRVFRKMNFDETIELDGV